LDAVDAGHRRTRVRVAVSDRRDRSGIEVEHVTRSGRQLCHIPPHGRVAISAGSTPPLCVEASKPHFSFMGCDQTDLAKLAIAFRTYLRTSPEAGRQIEDYSMAH
jgi:hypothetical protein